MPKTTGRRRSVSTALVVFGVLVLPLIGIATVLDGLLIGVGAGAFYVALATK